MKRTIVVTALLAIFLTACGQKAVEKQAEVTKPAEPVAAAPAAATESTAPAAATPAAGAPADSAAAPAAPAKQ